MVKETEKNKGHTKEFRSDDTSTYLTNVDQQKAMLLDTIDDAKAKPKKKVMEPIEIPPIISVPRYRHLDTITTKHYTKPPESNNRGPKTSIGLSKRFTQERLQEGKILKQIDKELAIERKNNQITNEGEYND